MGPRASSKSSAIGEVIGAEFAIVPLHCSKIDRPGKQFVGIEQRQSDCSDLDGELIVS